MQAQADALHVTMPEVATLTNALDRVDNFQQRAKECLRYYLVLIIYKSCPPLCLGSYSMPNEISCAWHVHITFTGRPSTPVVEHCSLLHVCMHCKPLITLPIDRDPTLMHTGSGQPCGFWTICRTKTSLNCHMSCDRQCCMHASTKTCMRKPAACLRAPQKQKLSWL